MTCPQTEELAVHQESVPPPMIGFEGRLMSRELISQTKILFRLGFCSFHRYL